jgi:hypothetical protein
MGLRAAGQQANGDYSELKQLKIELKRIDALEAALAAVQKPATHSGGWCRIPEAGTVNVDSASLNSTHSL